MTPILIFIIAIVFRTLSGFQNGAGYGQRTWALFSITFVMILACWLMAYLLPGIPRVLFLVSMLASGLIMYLLHDRKFYKWVHTVETILTGSFILALLLVSFWPVVFAHFIGMTGHKVGVNVLKGDPWNYNGTNDKSGKTWNVPVLDSLIGKRILAPWIRNKKFSLWHTIPKEYNIPRLSFNIRLVLAALSLVGFLLWIKLK